MPWAPATDGCEIYYEDRGSGPLSSSSSPASWESPTSGSAFDALSDQYRTIALDNRGYGRSAKPESMDAYSVEQHVADMRAVLDAAGVGTPVVLVAHSMGGSIASAFTLAHPERVAGIVYAGTYMSGSQLAGLGATAQNLVDGVASNCSDRSDSTRRWLGTNSPRTIAARIASTTSVPAAVTVTPRQHADPAKASAHPHRYCRQFCRS